MEALDTLRLVFWSAMVAIRLVAAGMFVYYGVRDLQIGGLFWGVMELQACYLAVENELTKRDYDRSWVGALGIPLLYCVGTVVPMGTASWFGQSVLLAAGLFSLWSRWSLWRGFSVAGSTWVGLCERGPYRFIRHPMLLAGVIGRAVVALEYRNEWNVTAWLIYTAAIVGVIFLEESWLMKRQEYRAYAERVPNRFLPGVW